MFKTLQDYYAAMGGETGRETVFGVESWDQVADPGQHHPVTVTFNWETGHIRAQALDGRIAHVGTVTADQYAQPEELVQWFQDYDGGWPVRSLQEIRVRIAEVNARFAFQILLDSLPLAGPDAVCVDCGKRAHRYYFGEPLCEDCLCRRKGGP